MELLAKIRPHAMSRLPPGTRLSSLQIRGLAEGILALREADGEYTFYFDSGKYVLVTTEGYEDVAPTIKGFPSGVGLVEDVPVGNFQEMSERAREIFSSLGGRISWYQEAVRLSY